MLRSYLAIGPAVARPAWRRFAPGTVQIAALSPHTATKHRALPAEARALALINEASAFE